MVEFCRELIFRLGWRGIDFLDFTSVFMKRDVLDPDPCVPVKLVIPTFRVSIRALVG